MVKFCPKCGTQVEGQKFCPECGCNLSESLSSETDNKLEYGGLRKDEGEQVILRFETELLVDLGRKQVYGDLSIGQSKNQYILTTERLIVEKMGMIKENREEMELYRFKDLSFKQSVSGKLRGIGDITVYSTDLSDPVLNIKRVRDPQRIAEEIRKAARNKKKSMNVIYRQDI